MAELTKETARALFMQQAERAGVGTMSPGEAAVLTLAASSKPTGPASVTDLSSGLPEYTIILSWRDGRKQELHPFLLTDFVSKKREWYERRIQDINNRMFPLIRAAVMDIQNGKEVVLQPEERGVIEEEAEFDRLDKEYNRLVTARYREMIPDLPDGLIEQQSQATMAKFAALVNEIILKELGVTGPNQDAQVNP